MKCRISKVIAKGQVLDTESNPSKTLIQKTSTFEHPTLIFTTEILSNTAYSELFQSVLIKIPAYCVNKPNMIFVLAISLMNYV